MAERNPSRPWSEEEDALLTSAVKLHGEHENWKAVASLVPGRTNKACRKRWLHSLSPTVRKSAWTPEEDSQLLTLYNVHGAKWSTIAREIPGRTDDACSKRYREALDPHLKKDEWTSEEDEKLIKFYSEIGGKWGQLGQELQRSGLGCRNRYRLLVKKASKLTSNSVRSVISAPSNQPTQPLATHSPPSEDSLPNWLPYYPPEAYPCFPHEENFSLDRPFRDPTPDISSLSPHIAPFQFSSSSLSAALSDLSQNSRALSTIYECEQPSPMSHLFQDKDLHLQPSQDSSPLPCEQGNALSRIFFGAEFDVTDGVNYSSDDPLPWGSSDDMNEHDSWAQFFPDLVTSQCYSLPPPRSDISITDHNMPDTVSSTLSTPFHVSLSLDSPELSAPVELPTSDQPADTPCLIPERRYPPPRRMSRRILKRPSKPQGTTRLSSMLPLTTDPSVKPYACGREICWPVGALLSSACFATSKELFDHSKFDHAQDLPGERPFRCALAGCGKSWKSLNGLQYHLQLSTAHFRNAMSSSFSSQRPVIDNLRRSHSTSGSSTEAETGDESKRTYVCHHPQCFKAYRQPSGLRYHLKHGHPSEMPAQLSIVPPALARQLPSKTKKMRRKTSMEDDI